MNNISFEHFPPSFPHRKLCGVNIKMNIFICDRFTEHGWSVMMRKKEGSALNEAEFQIIESILLAYTGSGSRVTIPAEVTEIGREAFENCAPLASVTFPKGLQRIGAGAFFRCTHLRWVKLPQSVTEIEHRAFYGCEHMMSVSFPKGLRVLGSEAFAHCRSLESVTIPDSVEEVGDDVFVGCHKLREVRVSEDWKKAHPDLFEKLMKR